MIDIYPFGQCTYWCARLEPWCMRYGNLGNALEWTASWRAHGGIVASTPSVGAIANFQPGIDGARPLGHVAVVERVGNPFVISEMNGPRGLGEADLRFCSTGEGVTFLVESNPEPTENEMQPVIMLVDTTIGDYLLLPSGEYIHIASGPDLTALRSLGYKEITISPSMHDVLVAGAPNK